MLAKALSSIKETLALDGYQLSFEQTPKDTINIEISAGPQACTECLVPREILESIILNALYENGITFRELNIIVPQSKQYF